MLGERSCLFPAAAILGFLWLMPEVVVGQEAQTAVQSCRSKCRGLGLDKVKAGDEHCGLVSRERKRTALDAACTLADSKREELQARAQERAESRCGHVGGREGCRCEGELRRWENVYTNHFSGRCWSECGWAYLIECERESQVDRTEGGRYPSHWWEQVPESDGAWWEILPQAAGPGEVILSKRNELGLLSNFAATPFSFRGQRYASLEGFWQSMKYPEGSGDPRAVYPGLTWEHTREEVMDMVAFEATAAGQKADENMEVMGIDWITFEGERILYKGSGQARHLEIVEAATWAKIRQNPEVERVVLATGDLILRPDHITEDDAPPAWRYFDIYMKIRAELIRREGTTQ